MTHRAALTPLWNPDTPNLRRHDSNHPPLKRRRVENTCEADWSTRSDTGTALYAFQPVEASFPDVRNQISPTSHSTQQFTVPGGSSNNKKSSVLLWDESRSGICQPIVATSPSAFSEANSVQYPTSIIRGPPAISISNCQPASIEPQHLFRTDAEDSVLGTPHSITAQPDQVCFGMITELRAEFDRQPQGKYGVHQKVSFVWPDELVLQGSTTGKLDVQSSEILQALSKDGILTQIIIVLPTNSGHKQGGTALRNTRDWLSCSVILYGPDYMFDDIGIFCQECELYLQDPIGCELNVPYRNPHRLSSDKDRTLLTFELQSDFDQAVVTSLQYSNFSDALVSLRLLKELETPLRLRTMLLPHQMQALYFMTQRERGWAFQDTWDVWKTSPGINGTIYRNNITGRSQYGQPTQFRGGVLADSMGLGKSLSMIALMSNDTPYSFDQALHSGSAENTATLLIVPPSLIQTWEEQFRRHLNPLQSLKVRRHHGSKRVQRIEELSQSHVIITTYQTVESEWRSASHSQPRTLFSVRWRRIVLDEAHYVSNRTCSTFKAICALEAHARWAVTGTPLQNRLGDLATMCEFLRVHPYENRERFEEDIVAPWKSGNDEGEAIRRIKRLVHSILLRRTQGVVDLPARTDLRYTLKFNQHEREHYNMVQSNVASKIDAAISGSSQSATFTSIIQQINELRLICNLGTQRRAKNTALPTSTIWDQRTALTALTTLTTAEMVTCTRCSLDLDATFLVNDGLGSELVCTDSTVRLFSCLKVICSSCLAQCRHDQCGCLPPCPSAHVLYNPDITYSGASSPSGSPYEFNGEPLPTKIKALVSDLLEQPTGTKSIVFSFWTSTLDLVQKGLAQSLITYTRYDGNTSQTNRSRALRDFRQDPHISVILMTISCSAVGLDITVASRAYIMEPQWNPTVEEQALARVHRMGQTKPVTTIRFMMENTFEERVVETQERKRRLAELLLSPEQHEVAEHGIEKLKYFRSLLR